MVVRKNPKGLSSFGSLLCPSNPNNINCMFFRSEKIVRFVRQDGEDHTIIANKNVVPKSRYQSLADYRAESPGISEALKNVSNVSPVIYNVEMVGLITWFESLAGKEIFYFIKQSNAIASN